MSSTLYKEEKQLVVACASGDVQSWERFVENYGRLLRATVTRVGGRFGINEADKEDVSAYIYEKLLEDDCRRLRAWRGKARLSTYLVQVTRNLVLDYSKKHFTGPVAPSLDEVREPVGPTPMPGETEWNALQLEALREAIGSLPPKQAMVMRLRLEGHSLRAIAKMLNRPVGTVSVENSRALEQLRQRMEEIMGHNS